MCLSSGLYMQRPANVLEELLTPLSVNLFTTSIEVSGGAISIFCATEVSEPAKVKDFHYSRRCG